MIEDTAYGASPHQPSSHPLNPTLPPQHQPDVGRP